MNLFYAITTLAMRAALRLLTRWKVRLLAPLPPGPFILAANHLSLIDPPLLSASLPLKRRIIFMAKEEIFRSPLAGLLARGVDAVPVRRGEADRAALRQAVALLQRGQVLGMFPEGTRSRGRGLGLGHPGTALIAHHGGVPIVPVAITGSEDIRGLGFLWQRPQITVTLGSAFTLPPLDGLVNAAYLTSSTKHIMERIAALLPPQYLPPNGEATPSSPQPEDN